MYLSVRLLEISNVMMKKYKSVEEYIEGNEQWTEALELLREMILSTTLTEALKWGAPAYLLGTKNLIGIAAFKSYVGIWFHQGVLLKDPEKKLYNAQEGVTKAMRQWRFSSVDEIRADKTIILSYIQEAIMNQEAGREIKAEKNKPLIIPKELQDRLNEDAKLKKSFESFNLTNKRAFTEHIASGKRVDTRLRRAEKVISYIIDGVGLHDKYRKC